MVAQPSFHTQRPIIVGDGIESPETITLRYEEEAAARANGEGESPTTLLPMATSTFKQQLPQLHGKSKLSRPYCRPFRVQADSLTCGP